MDWVWNLWILISEMGILPEAQDLIKDTDWSKYRYENRNQEANHRRRCHTWSSPTGLFHSGSITPWNSYYSPHHCTAANSHSYIYTGAVNGHAYVNISTTPIANSCARTDSR